MTDKRMGETSASEWIITALTLAFPLTAWGSPPYIMAVFAIGTAVIALVRMGETSGSGMWTVPRSPLWKPLFAMYILSWVHLFLSPVPHSSLLFLTQVTVALIFFTLLLKGPGMLPPSLVVLVWLVIQGLIMTFQIVTGLTWPPSGTLVNPNYLSTLILVVLGVSLGQLQVTDQQRRKEVLAWLTALACTSSLLVIGSRSATLGALILWVLTTVRVRNWRRLAAAVILGAALLVPSTVKHRVTEESAVDPFAYSRTSIWRTGVKVGMDYPVIGTGPNLFYYAALPYAFPTEELPVKYGRIARKPHNEYIRTWAEGGGAGVIILVVFLVAVARLTRAAWRREQYGPVLATGAFFFQACFHDLTESFALMLLAAWLLAQLHEPDAENTLITVPWGRFWTIGIATLGILAALWLSLEVLSHRHWYQGRDNLNQEPALAAADLERGMRLNPLHPGVARDLANARLILYGNSGSPEEFERARRAVARARSLNGLDSVPLRMESALYLELGRRRPRSARDALQASRDLLKEAISLEPKNPLSVLDLALVLWDSRDREAALILLDKALDLEPNYLEAHRRRIQFLKNTGSSKYEEARIAFDNAEAEVRGYVPFNDYEKIILK